MFSTFLTLSFCILISNSADTTLDWDTGVGNQGTTTIDEGDTVTWDWTDSAPHTVTSTDAGFTSSAQLTGDTNEYSVTFNTAGTYPYDCAIHPAMVGTIQVNAAPSMSPTAMPSGNPTESPISGK